MPIKRYGATHDPAVSETHVGQAPDMPTEVVPPPADVGPTAWAEVDDEEEIGFGGIMSRVDARIIVGVIVAVAIAAVSVAATIVLTKPHDAPAPSVVAAPRPPAPPPPKPSADDRFIQLENAGFPPGRQVINREEAIKGAHIACEYIGEGHSIDEAVQAADDTASATHEPAIHQMDVAGINAALSVYCPEYRSQQARDDAFIAALTAHGWHLKDGPDKFRLVVNAGREVCKMMDQGKSRGEMVDEVYNVHTEGETRPLAENFVAAAIRYYCPQFQ